MSYYDQSPPGGVPRARPNDGLSWSEAAHFMRLHGRSFTPPAHMSGMSLAQVEARAREETRALREAQEAKERAARIENAPRSIERALLDPPSPKRPLAAQRGWRQRVRFLNQFRRCRTYREAAARIGVDESTVRRWRRKFPAFARRCDEIVEERYRENSADLRLRAGEPRTRPVFFRGKQVGEHVIHDDRALMFLMKLDDAARARVEAREERREQRAHEIRLREMEIAARRELRGNGHRPQSPVAPTAAAGHPVADDVRALAQAAATADTPTPERHAFAAHELDAAEGQRTCPINGLPAVPAGIAPPRVVEVAPPPAPPSPSTDCGT